MAVGRRLVLACVAAGALVGCGTSESPARLRISGEGGVGPVLSRSDLRSARADVDPATSQPVVLLELTPSGQKKFRVLTADVARAGRRRHRPAHILISVNGKLISRPYIDYHVFPNGVPADNGIQMDVTSIRTAHDLAAKLHR
jgi:preprotein translocase subunit SecD